MKPLLLLCRTPLAMILMRYVCFLTDNRKNWSDTFLIFFQDMIQSYLQKKNYRESMQLEIYPEYLQWTPKEYGQSRSRTKNK